MNVVVIGANGQLGSDVVRRVAERHDAVGLTHDDIDILDAEGMRRHLAALRPDVVINTAAYHVVPRCEEQPAAAFSVNAEGALNLARLSEDLDFHLVHYSTDYVFDGHIDRPYRESDAPNPLNVYGATKLCGEYFVRNYCARHAVVRVSGIYGAVPCRAKGSNFVTSMFAAARSGKPIRVVTDEVLTPTSTAAIAENTLRLVESNAHGLFHMTAQGACSWYEFACAIFEFAGMEVTVKPITVASNPPSVQRPHYSVLSNAHLASLDLDLMPHWRDDLRRFIDGMMGRSPARGTTAATQV